MHQLAELLSIDTSMSADVYGVASMTSKSSRYIAVPHRATLALQVERPGVTPEQTIRTMRLARHAYGGSRVALLESDDPGMIETFRRLELSIKWLQLPRC